AAIARRVVTIPVLHCTAWQDIKAKPTRSLSYNGAFHQLWGRPGTNHSPRYTALLAVFAWRGHRMISRRQFIIVLGGSGMASPLAAHAQAPPRTRRLAWLGLG